MPVATKIKSADLEDCISAAGYTSFAYPEPGTCHPCLAYRTDRSELLSSVANIVGWEQDEEIREALIAAFDIAIVEEEDGFDCVVLFPSLRCSS